jgi:hypothetical protein
VSRESFTRAPVLPGFKSLFGNALRDF